MSLSKVLILARCASPILGGSSRHVFCEQVADHGLGLVVEGGNDLVGVLFRVVKSQAADREIDDFMTVPGSRPG